MTLAFYYLIKLLCNVPLTFGKEAVNMFAARTSILMTNVRGPPVPYHIGRSKSIKVTTFMPNLFDIPGGFAIVSH